MIETVTNARTRFVIARDDVAVAFDSRTERIYDRSALAKVLDENRAFWRLQDVTVGEFVSLLIEAGRLREVRFGFPGRSMLRYTWGDVPLYPLVQSLKPEGYFTHYSAMHLHGLTEQVPKTIYLNSEQKLRAGGGQLTQGGIDRAFKGRCRVSQQIAEIREHRVCLLNGQNTDRLGVMELPHGGYPLRVTDIERTLIDATVRPVYSGGVFEVAKAYEIAKDKISVNKLAATLRTLNFTYPYHQSVGFYLERAGYKDSQLQLMRQFSREYDFYLDYQMKGPRYLPSWKLYVPQGL
ncbi:MAG: hypothetical protein SGJ19_23975 [Planctomycetia bacterium]|nr:hypothetical protein [Planctomycetia bacterium]